MNPNERPIKDVVWLLTATLRDARYGRPLGCRIPLEAKGRQPEHEMVTLPIKPRAEKCRGTYCVSLVVRGIRRQDGFPELDGTW